MAEVAGQMGKIGGKPYPKSTKPRRSATTVKSLVYLFVLAVLSLESPVALAPPALATPPPEAGQTRRLVPARLRVRRAVAGVSLPRLAA